MISLNELCRLISLPDEAADLVCKTAERLDWAAAAPAIKLFYSRDTWMDGVCALRELFSQEQENKNGFHMLTCMLEASRKTFEDYIDLGIGENIFAYTFKMFSRFVGEHKESFGEYGFDRDFWTCRIIAMEDFRIGEMEYEMETVDGHPRINLHIPSDASLTPECCRSSVRAAKSFFEEFFPQYHSEAFVCSSWLLSPRLEHVLRAGSNIMKFQNAFRLIEDQPDDIEYMTWVFKKPGSSLDELPGHTSLQRNIRQYLKNGGKIGSSIGILEDEDFGTACV